jgi:hypothetical protein
LTSTSRRALTWLRQNLSSSARSSSPDTVQIRVQERPEASRANWML